MFSRKVPIILTKIGEGGQTLFKLPRPNFMKILSVILEAFHVYMKTDGRRDLESPQGCEGFWKHPWITHIDITSSE
jgi:hypothetical protein